MNITDNKIAEKLVEELRKEIFSRAKRSGMSMQKLSLYSDTSFSTIQRFIAQKGGTTLHSFVKMCDSLDLEIKLAPRDDS